MTIFRHSNGRLRTIEIFQFFTTSILAIVSELEQAGVTPIIWKYWRAAIHVNGLLQIAVDKRRRRCPRSYFKRLPPIITVSIGVFPDSGGQQNGFLRRTSEHQQLMIALTQANCLVITGFRLFKERTVPAIYLLTDIIKEMVSRKVVAHWRILNIYKRSYIIKSIILFLIWMRLNIFINSSSGR